LALSIDTKINDLESLYCTSDASFVAQHGHLKKDRPILKCSPGTLLSGGMRLMQYS